MENYLDFPELFRYIPHQVDKLEKILEQEFVKTAPGSSHNHQAWEGGYLDHVRETMNIALVIYKAILNNTERQLMFTIGDALLVLFIHDLEKPYRYQDPNYTIVWSTKDERREFRNLIIAQAGIELTPVMQNALEYVEGEHDYSSEERKMGPLAAFCHMVDVASARIWYYEGREKRW